MPPPLPLVFDPPRRAMPPRHFADLDEAGRAAAVTDLGLPAFRGKQLANQYYGRLIADPHLMTDLPAAVREQVADALFPRLLDAVREIECDAGETRKMLWRAVDGTTFESVLMRYPQRNTVCISSQAGCGMACPFCATAQDRRTRAPGRACPTSCSWAWGSRWPTTIACWRQCSASPRRRHRGSA